MSNLEHEAATSGGLARSFAGKMFPLAALVGLFVCVLPPVLYGLMAWDRLDHQAEVHAEHMAQALTEVARQQPYLWSYNAHKVVEATASHKAIQELGAARITDCSGATLFSSRDLKLGSGHIDGPVGWSPIRDPNRVVAWVQVTMDSESEARVAKHIVVGSVLFGVALGWFLFILPTRVVRRQARELDKTVAQLAQAEAGLVEANAALQRRIDDATAEVRQLSSRVVSIQEEERSRIARDLHDGLGQMLTALRLDLERQHSTLDAQKLCDTTLSELRRIVRDLRPVELETMPFVEVLRHYAERFEVRTQLPTSFRCIGQAELPEEVAICIFRVLQEALTNISRHSNASEVGISLTYGASHVTLEVVDDGQGFEPETTPGGLGLRSMRERALFLGGTLDVESGLNHSDDESGTRIRASIPCS